jgi:hypothetical protein
MNWKARTLPVLALVFIGALAWSGWCIIDYSEIHPPNPRPTSLTGVPKVIFGVHLWLWMILGMASNYLWDLFRDNKSWRDISWRGLFMPVFVAPIVFFSIWSIWKGDEVSLTLPLIAFQNGFFWQVVFSKAGPVDRTP